jgi:hypothetical protein
MKRLLAERRSVASSAQQQAQSSAASARSKVRWLVQLLAALRALSSRASNITVIPAAIAITSTSTATRSTIITLGAS